MNIDELLIRLKKIVELEDNLRGHINDGVLHNKLLSDEPKWWMLCSALDILGDTTLAFKDYIESNFPENTGLQYIYAYGVMQCFILQQDSVKHLYEVFDVEWKWLDSFKKIRKIRNASIGHTILNNEGGRKEQEKDEFNNFISRITINKSGFDLLRYSQKLKETTYDRINIFELLNIQLKNVQTLLENLIKNIGEMEMDVKKKFEHEKLIDLLPISYWFEKIHSIYSPSNKQFALKALRQIAESYIKVKESLSQRLMEEEDVFNELEDYLCAVGLMEQSLNEDDDRKARIISFYLSHKNDYFKEIMKEIDENFKIRNPL